MRRSRLVLILVLLVLVVGALWLWWNKPKPVDMATYAPANSLLFLESNRPLRVAESIATTATWRSADENLGLPDIPSHHGWFQGFVRSTGIGPTQSVILSRSQVAIVIADFGATEEGEVLNLKPEGAVVVETHTSERRIRPVFEPAIEKLAKANYDNPTSRRTTIDGVEFIEWKGSDPSRQIVATIHGTVVIVGNSERAVQNCLAVARGRQPSLKDDPELRRMRGQLAATDALAFGYVPSENSGRLLSVGLPLLLGRAPGDSDFQRVVARGAAKIFGSLAWSSHPFGAAIKDQYVVSFQPSIVAQLKPHFGSGVGAQNQRIPAEVYSVSFYRFENPLGAWQALKTSVASQVDALSAVIFSSILRSALLPYGIDEPEEFLQTITGDVQTMRFDPDGEGVLLIARILNYDALRKLVTGKMALRLQTDRLANAEVFVDTEGERAVTFIGDSVVMGTPFEVRRYAESQATTQIAMSDEKLRRVTYFTPSSRATIVTYTNDEDRVRSFISAIQSITGSPREEPQRMEAVISGLPYSATETTLTDSGLERATLSPLGQFSTLLPLLIPNKQTGVTNAPPAK